MSSTTRTITTLTRSPAAGRKREIDEEALETTVTVGDEVMALLVGRTMNARDAPADPTPGCLAQPDSGGRFSSACKCLSLQTPTTTTTVGIITVSLIHR